MNHKVTFAQKIPSDGHISPKLKHFLWSLLNPPPPVSKHDRLSLILVCRLSWWTKHILYPLIHDHPFDVRCFASSHQRSATASSVILIPKYTTCDSISDAFVCDNDNQCNLSNCYEIWPDDDHHRCIEAVQTGFHRDLAYFILVFGLFPWQFDLNVFHMYYKLMLIQCVCAHTHTHTYVLNQKMRTEINSPSSKQVDRTWFAFGSTRRKFFLNK